MEILSNFKANINSTVEKAKTATQARIGAVDQAIAEKFKPLREKRRTVRKTIRDTYQRAQNLTVKLDTLATRVEKTVDTVVGISEDPTTILPTNQSAQDALKRIAITTLGAEASNFISDSFLNKKTADNVKLLTNGVRFVSETRDFYIILRALQGQFLPKTMESSRGRYICAGVAVGSEAILQGLTSSLRSRLQNKIH